MRAVMERYHINDAVGNNADIDLIGIKLYAPKKSKAGLGIVGGFHTNHLLK